jgi:hypothetical protein
VDRLRPTPQREYRRESLEPLPLFQRNDGAHNVTDDCHLVLQKAENVVAVFGNRDKFDNGFAVLRDDYGLRFGLDFVHDGEAFGFENTGRNRF